MVDKDPLLPQAPTKRFQCQHPGGCSEHWNIPDGHRLCVLHDSCITHSYFTPEDCVICSAHILELLETPAEFILKKRKHYHLMARWIKARGLNSKIKWRDPQLALTLMIDPPSKNYTGDVEADLEAIMKGDKCHINKGSQHEKNFSSGEGTAKNDSEGSRTKIPIYLRLGPQSPKIDNESKHLGPLSERLGRGRGSVLERLDGGHGEWSERGRGRGEASELGTRSRGHSIDHGSRGRGSRDHWSERGGRGRGEWTERGGRGRGEWAERGGRGRGEWTERGGRGRGEWSERGVRGRGEWSERGARGRGEWSERGARGRGEWSERGGRGRGEWSERGGRGRGEWSERGGRGRGEWSERGASGRGDWVDHNSRGRGEWSERGNRGRGQWSERGISGRGLIRGTRGRGYDPSYRSRGRGFARGNRGRGQWSEHRNDISEEFDNLQGFENFDMSGEFFEDKHREKDFYEVEEVFELVVHKERDYNDKIGSRSKERPRDREDVIVYTDNNDFSDHHSSKHREHTKLNHREHDDFRHEKRHEELRQNEFRHEDLRHDEFRHEKRREELRHDEFLHEKRPHSESRHDEVQRDSRHSSRSHDELRLSTRSHDEFKHSSRAREEYRHKSRSHEEFRREERSHKEFRHEERPHKEFRHEERPHKEFRHEERPHKEFRHEERPHKEFRHEERPHKDLKYKEKPEFRHSSRSHDEYRREEKLHNEFRHKEKPELRPSSRLHDEFKSDERSSVEFRRKERPEFRRKERPEFRHSSSSHDEFRREEKLPKEIRREDRPHSHSRRISEDQETRHLENMERGGRRSARDELRSFLAGIPKEDIASDNGHGRESRRVTEREDSHVDVKLPSNAGSVWGDMIISAKRGKTRQNWEEPNAVSEVKHKPQRPDKYREVREELRDHVHKRDHVTQRRPAVHSPPRREVVVAVREDEKYQTPKTSRQRSQGEGDRSDYWYNREKDMGTRGSTKREVDIVGFSDSLSDPYAPQVKRKKTGYTLVEDSFNSSSRLVSVGPQAPPRTTSTHTVNDRYEQAPKAFPPPMRTTWEDNPPQLDRGGVGADVDGWSAPTQSNNTSNIDPQGCAASHILAARNAINSIRSEKSNPLQSQQPMSYEAFMNYFQGSVSSEKSINQYIEYKLEFKKLQFNQMHKDQEEKRYSVPLQPPETYPGPSSSGSGSVGMSVAQDPSQNYRPGSLSTKTNSWQYNQPQPMQHFPPPQHKADSYRIVH